MLALNALIQHQNALQMISLYYVEGVYPDDLDGYSILAGGLKGLASATFQRIRIANQLVAHFSFGPSFSYLC